MKHAYQLRVFPLRLFLVFIIALPLSCRLEIYRTSESSALASYIPPTDASTTLNAISDSVNNTTAPLSTFVPVPVFLPGIYFKGNPSVTRPPNETDLTMYYIDIMGRKIGQRLSGSEKEKQAADFIYQEFVKIGYKPEVQQFYFFNEKEEVKDCFCIQKRKFR